MKILLVDDVKMERMQLAIRLKQLGHTIEMAESGAQALALYARFEPDLVLLDISMPDMDGFEVSQHIRSRYADWVPIIFLSSHDEPSMIAKAIDAGGDDYLIKPVDKVVLKSKLIAMNRIAMMRRELKLKTTALAKANEELATLADEDGLTKVKNRRFIDSALQKMLSWHGRHNIPMSIILLDVDQFKPFNDNYGHIEGDKCLKSIASLLKGLFSREGEHVGRYGGEEFVVLLGHTDVDNAKKQAMRIQSALYQQPIAHEFSSVSNVVTVSQGVCGFVPTGHETCENIYKRADEAMYRAKQAGRNQFVAQE
jgi:diguanylate cyclase (GGDEF)-like protein